MATKKKTAGYYIDLHYKLKQERDAIIKKLNAKKAEIQAVADEATEAFGREDLVGGKGKLALGYFEDREIFSIADRSQLDRFVKKHGYFELYQNRVTGEAVHGVLARHPRLSLKSMGLKRIELENFRTRKTG